MSQPREGGFRAALLIIAIGLASFIGTRLGSSQSVPPPGEASIPSDQLSRCVSALERIVERLNVPRAATELAEPGKTRAEPSPLANEIADLEAAIGRLANSVKSIEEVASMTTTRATDLKIPQGIPDPRERAALEKLEPEERAKRYMFWSPQRVLDTFGKPDDVRPSPGGAGVKWSYGPEGGERYTFWYLDGVVAKVIDD